MIIILESLGQQSDLRFIKEKGKVEYMEQLNTISPGKNQLHKIFSGINEDFISFIKYTLIFNPAERKDAGELLKNPIFDSIRVPNLEIEPKYDCECEIDFKRISLITENKDELSTENYLELLILEITKVKSSKLRSKIFDIKKPMMSPKKTRLINFE